MQKSVINNLVFTRPEDYSLADDRREPVAGSSPPLLFGNAARKEVLKA